MTNSFKNGLHMPAEYLRHKCTYLLWPLRPDNWRKSGYFAQRDMVTFANAIAAYEPVYLGSSEPIPANFLAQFSSNVSVVTIPYDDIWIRDTGPTYRANGSFLECIDWQFNSWGGLFSAFELDNRVAREVAMREQLPVISADMVFEGGAMIGDGLGTIITTAECVLDDRRNPALSLHDADVSLRRYLAASNIIWVPKGLLYDETGGHVDNLCFFGNAETLFITRCEDRSNENYERSQEAYSFIVDSIRHLRANCRIVELPLAETQFITEEEAEGYATADGTIARVAGTPFCASYANVYLANGAVFVPSYRSRYDIVAAQILAEWMPERTVIQIPAREFALGGGALHCITKEVPAL